MHSMTAFFHFHFFFKFFWWFFNGENGVIVNHQLRETTRLDVSIEATRCVIPLRNSWESTLISVVFRLFSRFWSFWWIFATDFILNFCSIWWFLTILVDLEIQMWEANFGWLIISFDGRQLIGSNFPFKWPNWLTSIIPIIGWNWLKLVDYPNWNVDRLI